MGDEELILENIANRSSRIMASQNELLRFVFSEQVIESSLTCLNQWKNCSCETENFTQTDHLANAIFFAASVFSTFIFDSRLLAMSHEDYDEQSLATFLHLTPDQVRKMANRGKLPGRRVGNQWRFSQAEIHEWFEQRIGVSDQQELDQVERMLNNDPRDQSAEAITVEDLLAIDNVYVPFLARTKKSVIQRMCDQTAATGRLWDPVKMAEALFSREELHPTALGNGVALLHPRRPMASIIGDPFLALGITSSGIPFGGPRGCLTDVFFLIGSTSEPVHLKVLARLSRLLQQPEFLLGLRESASADEAYDLICQHDQALDE